MASLKSSPIAGSAVRSFSPVAPLARLKPSCHIPSPGTCRLGALGPTSLRLASPTKPSQQRIGSSSFWLRDTRFESQRSLIGSGSFRLQKPQGQQGSVVARAGKGDDDSVDAVQRIIAAAGYFLPFLDGVKYGRYLYLQYPFFRVILDPIVPAVQLYNGFPYAGFIAFFVLYLAVIQNPSLSRYVRYNCMQAVILDILMIVPALLERLLSFQDGVGFQLTVVFYNTVFLYLLACFIFGVGSCLLGKSPRLPLVADAAEAQVPF